MVVLCCERYNTAPRPEGIVGNNTNWYVAATMEDVNVM